MKKGYSFMDLGENPKTYTVEQITCQDALRINGAGSNTQLLSLGDSSMNSQLSCCKDMECV